MDKGDKTDFANRKAYILIERNVMAIGNFLSYLRAIFISTI